MKSKIAMSAVLLALAAVNGVAVAESMPKFAGGLLVDEQGMTLYTFDKDAKGKSNCSGGCAAAWPPAAVAADARITGEFTAVRREDGTSQWAYQGAPLYRFAGDAGAGDVNGDNQGSVWHVIKLGRAAQAAPAGSMSYSY